MTVAANARLALTTRCARRDRSTALGSVARSSRTTIASAVSSARSEAAAAHRDPQVRGRHGRGVVHAVTDQHHAVALLLQGPDVRDLVRRQQPGPHVGDADLLGQPAGRRARCHR